jgi:hypothetical protein
LLKYANLILLNVMNTGLTIGQSASGPVTIDVERLIESRLLVTASSGGGKSWLLRKILEQVSAKTQTIVIDKEGEFATLREKRDMVLAGPNGEVPADVRSSSLLCRRLMELNLSAVIDISEMKPSDQRAFVAAFCYTLVELPRSLWRPCVICIDETHELAPEGEKSTSSDAVALLGSKGRKRGYCLLAATQRLSKLSKDVAAECRNQFIGLMNLDVDLKRAADMLGFPKDRWQELRDLSPPGKEGEFFCFGPAFNVRQVTKMRSGPVETTHPKAGQGRLSKPPEPSARISGVLGELKDLAQKAAEEAKTLADAQKEIRELKRQLNAKPAPVTVADQKAIERAVAASIRERDEFWKGQMLEIKQESASVIKSIEEAVGTAKALFARSQYFSIAERAKSATPRAPSISSAVAGKPARTLTDRRGGLSGPVTALTAQASRAAPTNGARTRNAPGSRTEPPALAELQLGKCERSILTAMYWLRDEEVTPAKVGFYADYTAGSGSFNNALGRLRSSGLLAGWKITEAGKEAAEQLGAEEKPTGPELREWLRRKLGKAENSLLDALCEAYPERLPDDELGAASGYTAGSGSFNNALGRLRSIEAAEGYARDGGAKAADVFFE